MSALVCILAGVTLPCAAQAVEEPALLGTIQVSAPSSLPSENTGQYLHTTPSTTATGLALRPQHTPQPTQVLTRSLLNDHDMQSLRDMAALAPGLTVSRGQFYARGFALNQWMVDGVSVGFDKSYDLGQNLALYDRVDVVQGASGLMAGMGNPSAAINLVRKLPTATPRLELQLRTNRWSQRAALLDAAGPLNTAGSLRGRAVLEAANEDSHRRLVGSRNRTYYGVLEADLAAQTTLRLGASEQTNHRRDSLSDIPTALDGSDLHLPRHTNLGYDWEYSQQRTHMAFAQLEHAWDSGWQLRADLLRLRSSVEYLGTFLAESPPEALVQGLGHYTSPQTQNSASVSLRGPWSLGGQTHQLALGLSQRRGNSSDEGWLLHGWRQGLNPLAPPVAMPIPDLTRLPWPTYRYRKDLEATHTGAWLAAQLQLHPRWQLVVGGRWNHYQHHDRVQDNLFLALPTHTDTRQSHFSHYAGLVWQWDAQHSAYLQTSNIFQPRTERGLGGQILPLTRGNTLGAGVQGRYRGGQLQAGLHLFQTTQRNAPDAILSPLACPTYPGVPCYRAVEQVRSHGAALQLQGQITPVWQVSASATWVHSRYARDALRQGQRFDAQLPRQLWQLAALYRVPDSRWRLGASLYRQSMIDNTGNNGWDGQPYRIRQGGYTLLGLVAMQHLTPRLQLQLNVRNLLDKRYYQSIDAPTFTTYGPPRSWHMVLRYRY